MSAPLPSALTLEERYGEALDVGRRLFARHWMFTLGVPSMKFLPAEGPLEVAFAGRSNVGKSSLINAIVNQKGLARTSNTPGRTQELNYFIPEGMGDDEGQEAPIALVDMPGYGFAKAPKAQVDAWTNLIFSYLRGRSTLRRVFVLIDSRHGVKKNDEDVLALLDEAAVSYQFVLTKADKPKKSELQKVVATTQAIAEKRPAAFPHIVLTSSEKGEGIAEIRAAIAQAIS